MVAVALVDNYVDDDDGDVIDDNHCHKRSNMTVQILNFRNYFENCDLKMHIKSD